MNEMDDMEGRKEGRKGKGRDGKGREGKGRERNGTEGTGTERDGTGHWERPGTLGKTNDTGKDQIVCRRQRDAVDGTSR